ncbi:PQQ-binding-like beta-propeller repeat protein [Gordonia araii]|nr:PQQ-binding-like beta-propeller repeat protein [Gordonia araii]
MEPAPLALAVPVPPYPTSLGNVAYRIRQTDELRNTAVRVGGPGFIIATPRAIRAHDGTTGEMRWEMDAAELRGLDSPDARESIAVFGYGDDATVMIVGTDITIGLDAATGRLLWRSAAPEFRPTSHDYAPQRAQVHVEHPSTVDEKPKPPRMVVLDPRRGTIRWQTELPCQPGYDSTEKFVVTSVCGKPAEFEITDIESRTTRRIRLTTPTNSKLTAPAYLGEGLFGAFYRTAVPHRDRATSFDEGTAMFVTVFDAATGAEVDHFELTSRISSVNGGVIAMGADYSKRNGVYGQVISRNLQTRKSSSVPVRVQGSDFDPDWLGGSLLVRGDEERGSVPLVVDPRTGTITRRGSACIDSLQDLQSVPGAVLEVCSGHDGPWGFEIVGLR